MERKFSMNWTSPDIVRTDIETTIGVKSPILKTFFEQFNTLAEFIADEKQRIVAVCKTMKLTAEEIKTELSKITPVIENVGSEATKALASKKQEIDTTLKITELKNTITDLEAKLQLANQQLLESTKEEKEISGSLQKEEEAFTTAFNQIVEDINRYIKLV